MNNFSNILYSHEVLEFVKSAQDFCRWVEDPDISDKKSFIRDGLGIITRLYSYIIQISGIEPVFNELNEKFVTEEDWARIYRKITTVLGEQDDYLDIPDISEFDRTELITRKISEDISDIYQDLRDFLEVFRNSPEEIMNDALWECKTTFENIWGEKLLRVTRAMHKNYFDFQSREDFPGIDKYDDPLKNIDTRDWFISKRQQEFGDEQ